MASKVVFKIIIRTVIITWLLAGLLAWLLFMQIKSNRITQDEKKRILVEYEKKKRSIKEEYNRKLDDLDLEIALLEQEKENLDFVNREMPK